MNDLVDLLEEIVKDVVDKRVKEELHEEVCDRCGLIDCTIDHDFTTNGRSINLIALTQPHGPISSHSPRWHD